jgi:ferric-dicitrate binding protein FerR (iron transport regulator)
VNSNKEKPFIVVTRDIRIRVTGTSFNVSSYSADDYTQTVLVKGEVKIIQNTVLAKSMEMKPGERVIFRKSGESFSKDRVDVAMYSSWINGFLIFDNELTTEIFKKLERIYNQRIIADPGLSTITFSGKLDLQEDIKDVLDNIAFASGLNITRNGEYFIIKP